MKAVSGNLLTLTLEGHFDVIVHGCNCFCTMEAGIALAIQQEFPEAYAADLVTVKGDRNKLGDFSSATVIRNSHKICIVNGYTQFHYSGDNVLIDYNAIAFLFKKIKQHYSGKRIGYPKIGAGLGGGDWDRISTIIDQELRGEDHTLVIFP